MDAEANFRAVVRERWNELYRRAAGAGVHADDVLAFFRRHYGVDSGKQIDPAKSLPVERHFETMLLPVRSS